MTDIFFWRNWDRSNRKYYQALLFFIGVLICGSVFFLVSGSDTAYNWLVTSSLDATGVPLENMLPVLKESYGSLELLTINHTFSGSGIEIDPLVTYGFLLAFILGLLICLIVVTYLGRYWYIISVGLFVVFLVLLGLERIGLFGWYNKQTTLLFFLSYVPITYYFNSINTSASVKSRFLSLLGITMVLALLIYNFTEIDQPFLYLASYVILPSFIFTIVLIFLVAHEIIYFILLLATQNTKDLDSKNTRHFLILSLIYLINVLLVYLKNRNYIDWDVVYVNPFFLLLISIVFGFWGLKDREVRYKNIVRFYPFVAYLYCALVIISLSTIIFHFAQGNDSAIESLEDIIVFSHMGFGLMFFLYVIVNFISLLMKNLPVYKIAFKEDNFPYITSRIAGTIIAAALFFLSNKAALYQAMSSYYNTLGDIHYFQSDLERAKVFYNEGAVYGFDNHKSNYMLGALNGKSAEQIVRLEKATKKNPTEFSFVNLGQRYTESNRFFDAIFVYQTGLKKFPKSPTIKNNLALLYSNTAVDDSTFYFLNSKESNEFKSEVRLTNLLGVFAKKDMDISEKISHLSPDKSDRFDVASNFLSYLILKKDRVTVPEIMIPEVKSLNLITYAYLNNLGLWCYLNGRDEYINLINPFIQNGTNHDYIERLTLLKALNLFGRNQVNEAFKTLRSISGQGTNAGFYQHLMGVWSLKMGSSRLSQDYFESALNNGYTRSTDYLLLIQILRGYKNEEGQIDQSFSADYNLIKILLDGANKGAIPDDSPEELKAIWLIRNAGSISTGDVVSKIADIQDPILRDWTAREIEINKVKSGNNAAALVLLETSRERKNIDFWKHVTLSQFEGFFDVIKEKEIPELDIFKELAEGTFKNDVGVADLGNKNAFCEVCVLSASKYFNDVSNDDEKAYAILLEAIDFNKYSANLIKAYIDQCFKMGLTSYAESALLRLLDILEPEAYRQYELVFDRTKENIDQQNDNW